MPLFNVDSANIFPHHWSELAKQIIKRCTEDYRGVVIAHGTDTMAFTACALALALGPNWRKPVVLTGAQVPPNVPHGDARVNLYRACLTVLHDIPEVVVCFGNYVFRGCHAQKKEDRDFNGFHSPSCPELAHITEEIQVFHERLRKESPDTGIRDASSFLEFSDRIVTIRQSPGLNPEYFKHLLDPSRLSGCEPVEGIVFQTLGAGNVPSQELYSFIPFIREAKKAGIPVVISSQYAVHPATHTRYAPGTAPIEAGAIPVGDMTCEAAETKLRWVLAQVRTRTFDSPEARVHHVEKLMHHDFVGEINRLHFTR